jgi:prepilin-type N-terminal cleavage/methylation domain-containing protein
MEDKPGFIPVADVHDEPAVHMTKSPRTGLRGRDGFSLAELMVVMVLLGIVGTAIMNVIIRQQRFYRATDEVINLRTRLREGTSILPVDLRALGPEPLNGAAGDIINVTENSITFRSTYGSSIVCGFAGTTIHIPPLGSLNTGVTYTSWLSTPIAGDSVALYNAAGNTWTLAQITAAPTASGGGCPAGAGAGFFRRAADPDGLQFTVSTVGPGIQNGSPIRFLKRVRYGLYQASDNRWYLGFAFVTGDGSGWSPQPVSGPYRAHFAAGDARNGLRITCWDTLGTAVAVGACANNGAVGRVDFTFRTESQAAVTKSGVGTNEILVDSMTVRVALRNST